MADPNHFMADPPIEMLLSCPQCGKRHVDVGEFATKPHHTHSCQLCGHTWRPAVVATVGVQFLPGFKDAEDPVDVDGMIDNIMCAVERHGHHARTGTVEEMQRGFDQIREAIVALARRTNARPVVVYASARKKHPSDVNRCYHGTLLVTECSNCEMERDAK